MCSPGCLQDVLRTIRAARRLRRCAHWRTSRTCSPPAFPTSSVPPTRLRRLVHPAGPVPSRLCSPVASPTSSGPSSCCDVSFTWPVRCHRGCGLRLPRGRLRDRRRGCDVSFTWPVRCHRGCGLRLPRGRPRYHRRGRDASFTWPVRWPSRLRAPVAWRTSSGPSSWLRRIVHLPGLVPSRLCSPVASRTSAGPSVRLRRFLHFAYPAAVKNCSPTTFGNAFGSPSRTPSGSPSRTPQRSSPRSPPDHPRAYISRIRRVSRRRLRVCQRSIFGSIGKFGTGRRRRTAK